jgi:DNA-directed RNA polymerase subunit L
MLMTLEIGLTNELTNTQYAPLAVLCAHYQQHHRLELLTQVQIPIRERDFKPADKLIQVLLSILAGCETLVEVNSRLESETNLARIWGWPGWADQSTLSRTLDALTLMNLDQLRHSSQFIWYPGSQVKAHDWRAFLWLDFDLSGLPCGPKAQASQKGYFSGKKTSRGVN